MTSLSEKILDCLKNHFDEQEEGDFSIDDVLMSALMVLQAAKVYYVRNEQYYKKEQRTPSVISIQGYYEVMREKLEKMETMMLELAQDEKEVKGGECE